MQPLWYVWIFDDLGFKPIDKVIEYYSKAIKDKKIKFPEKYFILKASVEVLRKRKESDKTRTRRNFRTHLKLIQPQLEYFEVMQSTFPAIVQLVNADEPKLLAQLIASNLPMEDNLFDSELLFENLCQFLKSKHKTEL
jgi:hypothetical protein